LFWEAGDTIAGFFMRKFVFCKPGYRGVYTKESPDSEEQHTG